MFRRFLVTIYILALLAGLTLPAPHPVDAAGPDKCPPLPPPAGSVVSVSNVAGLQDALSNLTSNTTISVAEGHYYLTNMLRFRNGVQNVALRSASGNRDGVVIHGNGMSNPACGNVCNIISIEDADDVLIADLTLRDVYYHPVQIHGEAGPQRPRLYNLHLIDAGEQFVKVSTAGPPGPYSDDGIVECSLIEYTDRARSDYTNGVDVLAGARWTVRDNVFRNIRAPVGELAGPTVLMWRNTLDSIVERNQFIECDRAIALGLSWPDSGLARDGESTYDHQGGIVRNNFIYRAGAGDIGVTANFARDFKIYHNTVLLNDTFPWGAIEYRFSVSTGEIRYNLTDAPIWQRDEASAIVAGNVTNAEASWFADAGTGDLHLRETATEAIDQATSLDDVSDDYDGETRPHGPAPDVGADEYGSPPPAAVTDLRVTGAYTTPGTLYVTLGWTAPGEAVTTTLRYQPTAINEANWAGALPLAEGLAGNTESLSASVPYSGDTLYFALRWENAEREWAAPSNNAFWPSRDVCLPVVMRNG